MIVAKGPGRRRCRTPAVVVAALLVLSGCGVVGNTGASQAQHPRNEISVWFPGTDQTEIDLVTKTIVPRFEKETGATVKVTYLDWGDLSTKLNAAFAAGTAPDVFGHGPAAVADFVHNERVAPLTPYVDAMSASDREDLARALPGGRVNGTQYLMPLWMQGSMIVYRSDEFKKAGLDPQRPPATWEGVLEAARKLTRRSGGDITRAGLLLPTHPLGLQQTFAGLLASDGGTQISADGKKALVNSAAGIAALTAFVDTYRGPQAVGNQLGAAYQDAPTAQQPLVTGDAAMTVLTAQAAVKMEREHPEMGIRAMPLPSFDGHQGKAMGGAGSGLMINRDSPEKKLAWQFISYMLSSHTSLRYTQGIGALPVRLSDGDSAYVRKSHVVTAFDKELGNFVPNPNVPGWTQIRDTLAKYLEQAVRGKQSPQQALDDAAAEIDGLLAASQ